jgi:hypothetical protein
MEISQSLREYISEQFHHVSVNINTSPSDLPNMVYNFSACHAALNRVLNIEFNDELVLLHTVFNGCYTMIANRISLIGQNVERQVQFPRGFPEKLATMIDEFASRFEDNLDVYDLLPSLTKLCYITTGNGYFLYQTGRLTI